MSLVTQLTDFATRVATETKALRTLINGNAADLTALTTTAKGNLVVAINEIDAAVGAGSPTTLDDLTDVALSAPDTGHLVRHNGTNWVNVLGTTHFATAAQGTAAGTALQPGAIGVSVQAYDADLDALAAVASQTAYGRAFLALANQAALVALLPSYQPLDSDLTAIAAVASQTAYGRALLTQVSQATLTAALAAATEALPGIVELASTAEAVAGVATNLVTTPAGVQAALNALIDAAPGTLNTLNELAAALADDPNFAATMTTALAGKQPLDTDLTAIAALVSAADRLPYSTGVGTWALATYTAAARTFDAAVDQAAQRTALDVWSKTEIGSVTTDFVATFNAGLV